MPITVPTYGKTRELPSAPNQLPSVRQTAAPSADQLGGNARVPTDYIGKGMKSAGNDLFEVGMKMQEREDADMIFRAETVLKDRLRAKSEEWSNRRGVQAWDLTKDASQWWDSEATKAAEGLNERQRVAFDQTLARMRGASLDTITRFEAEQRRTSLDESAQASIVGSINFAAANPDNPEAINAARGDIARSVLERGRLNGWTPERTQVEAQTKLTALHKQVLEGLVDKDPTAAEAYLKQHREEIAGAERDTVNKLVEGASRLKKAQSFADDVMARGITEAEAMAEARQKFEGEDERIAVNEVKVRHQEIRAAREAAQKDALDAAYGEMGPTGTVASIKPSTWAKLGGDAQRRLIEQDEARITRRESRAAARENREYRAEQRALTVKERETFGNYSSISQQLVDDPGSVTQERIAEEVRDGKLTHSQGNTLLNAILRTDVSKDKVHTPTLLAVLKPIADELKYTGKNADKRGILQQAAEERILADQMALGRPLKQDEVRKIVRDLTVEGYVENSFLWFDDDNVRRFEVLGTENAAKWKSKAKHEASGVIAPGSANPPAGGAVPRVRIRNAEDYARLAPGTKYIDPQGKPRTKP